MIEIGPNLLEILNKIIKELKHNNPTCQEILSEFEIMERLITNIYLAEQAQDKIKTKNKDVIEIGPNLKNVLLEIINKLDANGALTSSYVEVLDKLKELIPLSPEKKVYECNKSDNKKYPSESGYYWFYNNGDILPVHYNSVLNGFLIDGCYHDFCTLRNGTLKNSYFIQPVQPIPEPGKCIIRD